MLLLPRDVEHARAKRERGSLLIEMIVILTIIGISLLGVLSQSSTAVRGNRLAEQGSEATSLAQAKLEELKAKRFADLAGGGDGPMGPDGTSQGIYIRTWAVTPEVVNGLDARRVTVTVTWPETGQSPSSSLSTLIVDIPQYAEGFPTVVQETWRRD